MTEYQLSGIKLDDAAYCNGCSLLVKHTCVLVKHDSWQIQIVGENSGEIKTFRPANCPLNLLETRSCDNCRHEAGQYEKGICISCVRKCNICDDNWKKKE